MRKKDVLRIFSKDCRCFREAKYINFGLMEDENLQVHFKPTFRASAVSFHLGGAVQEKEVKTPVHALGLFNNHSKCMMLIK